MSEINRRDFHLGDILSVTTGRLLSLRGMVGFREILNYIARDKVFDHQIPRALDQCGPWLVSQYPQFSEDEPEMKSALLYLSACIESPAGQEDRWHLIAGWLVLQATRLGGEYFSVERLPADDWEKRDPVNELEKMIGRDRVIVFNMEDEP